MKSNKHLNIIAAVLANFLGISHSPNTYAEPVKAVAQNKDDKGNIQAERMTGAALDTDNTRLSDSGQRFWVEQVVDGLKFPSSMAWLPNGDALIAEREGGLRVLRHGVLDRQPLPGTPATFKNARNGIKEVLLDSDYRANQTLYLLISEGNIEQYHAAVYRAKYSASGLVDVERIFRSKDEGRGGSSIAGRMLFLHDKTLLVAITSYTNRSLAQQLSSHLGKIVRINRDGSVPPDNPFLSTPDALPEIWSYGHRVPLGLYQDAQTHAIWEVESGARGGDELNLLKGGANYGYDKAGWGFAYENNGAETPVQSDADIEEPFLIWMPSVTPSGLARYRGTVYSGWDGDYFVGHLSANALERLRIEGSRVVLQEKLLSDLQERIRDIREGPDHLLYLLTDHENGRLLRLVPGAPREDQVRSVANRLGRPNRYIDPANNRPADPEKGKALFIDRCAACHGIGDVVPGGGIGPDLQSVVGRKAGSLPGFSYSSAMAGRSTWTERTLDLFLRDPAGYVPGTRMSAASIDDDVARSDLIAFLKQHSRR